MRWPQILAWLLAIPLPLPTWPPSRQPTAAIVAHELAERVGKSPTAVSQHLAKLRLTRIVTTRHEGTRVFYRLVDEHAVNLVDEALKQAEHAMGTPHHHQVS